MREGRRMDKEVDDFVITKEEETRKKNALFQLLNIQSHYHMFAAKKSPAKEIPLLGKDKNDFSLPFFFHFFWKTVLC